MRYRLMNYAPAIDRWAEIRFNMLTVNDLKDQIPDYSKDIKLNLSSLISLKKLNLNNFHF